MMSRNLELPMLTPSTVTVGREQFVIVEFAGIIPQSSLVTFNFYHCATGKKLSTIPIVPLGPHTAKAKFPEFSKNGEVEVIVHINREESTLMPRFRFHVQSQLEAIFAPALQGSNRKALLASIMAYLTHCDEKNKELYAQADTLLCNLLHQIHTFELSNWSVGALLTGKHGAEENLLHFCARRHLSETAEYLLLSMPNSNKQEYLYQRSSDNKTPIELAQKNDMRRVVDEMTVQAGSTSKKTKGKKKKSLMVEKSRSIDSQINHLCIPGSPDVVTKSSTFSQSPDHKRKDNKASNLKALKKHFKKDKGVPVVSMPHQPYINEFGEAMIAPTSPGPQSPSRPISQSMERIDRTGTWSESSNNPFSDSNYNIPSPYGTTSPVPPSSPLLRPRHEIPTRSSVTFPRSVRPGSRTDSVGSSSSSFDQGDSRLLQVEQRQARPVSSALSGASDHGNALSKAMKELKSRALYVAEVVQEYNWASVAQGDSDCILKMGHRVFVTQEGVEGDHKMCLGVWMGRYGKLPLAILRPLPHTELQNLKEEIALEESSDDDNYEKVDDGLWLGEEDDIYKVPRNVPAHSYIPGSDSEDDQPLYDVPPNRFRNLPTETPNIPSSPYMKTSDSEEDPVYDVPPNRHLLPEGKTSDHDYLNIPREQLLAFSELVKQPKEDDDMKQSAKTDHDSQIPISQMEDGVREAHGVTEKKKRSHTIAECITFPVDDTANEAAEDQEDDSNIYDDLDSALSETLLLIQSVVSNAEQPMHNNTITPSLDGNHKAKVYEGTDVTTESSESSDTYSHLIPTNRKTKYENVPINNESIPPTDASLHINVSTHDSNKGGTDNSVTYSSVTPKTERKTITPNSSHEIGYAEITAVKNIVQGDSEQMTVGRISTTPNESDDVFQQPSSTNPAPKPKKRTRFLTSTNPPRVSPKPKPRRLTTPLKSEGDEPASSMKIEKILANSLKRGEVRIATPVHQTHAKTEQSAAKPGEIKPAQQTSESTKPPYVNVEVRTKKKPPPSPPRKRSSHSTSSPATMKKPSPQVAPKPVVAKKQ